MTDFIVVEETAAGFPAYSPHMPGCVATGSPREGAQHLITESFHIEGTRAEGFTAPEPP
jgi:hypothetical protein